MAKIWLINHYTNPPNEPGDARHHSCARELMRRGHEVRIVACNFDHLQHKHLTMSNGRTWEHTTIDGVPFTWITACAYKTNYQIARIWNMWEFAFRTWKAEWAKGLEAPDLILGANPDPFAALAAERLATRYRVPFVLEICDPWPYSITEVGGHSLYNPFVLVLDKIMRFLYKRAARIVMLSRDSGELLARYGAYPEKLVWIPHGVDLGMDPEPRPAPDDGIFTVTYLGAHNRWNSLDVILDTAKLVQNAGTKDVLIRFVGDGVSKPGLIERAKAEKILNVRFDDPVSKRQVPEVKHTSDAFIINNRKDGASKNWMSFNKIYDYLAGGRPIVFGSYTDNDPVRESGAGISVEADNPRELAQAIQFLKAQPREKLIEYGARGRKHVEEHYSTVVLMDRFEALTRECLGKGEMRPFGSNN